MPVVVSFPGRESSDWQRQGCYLCLYQDDVRVCRALATTMWHALQGSTALLQVPCHTILAQGFDAGAHARLVRTNWIRTCCWYGCMRMRALCVECFVTVAATVGDRRSARAFLAVRMIAAPD